MVNATIFITSLIAIGAAILAGLYFILKKFLKGGESNDAKFLEENLRLKTDLSQKDRNIGELLSELQNEKTIKDQLSGKNKQLFVEITNLKAENVNVVKEKERLVKEISDLKATESIRDKEFNNKIQKLDDAKNSLDEEKQRIRREDIEKLQREKDERNRMWAEHEENVKIQLVELCKTPQYAFQYYDNNNLPIGFGGKFKPDFLVEFLEQFVIFDAKVSEADLQNYINGNVKSTVEKIKNDPKIYSSIFFIVPTDAMKSLKKIRFYEQGYEFFIISPETIEIVLASLKKISSYELAQKLDPRDRENIVNLIAEFDYHINMRNALDILSSESGVRVLKKVDALKKDIKEEISFKKGKMRLQQFTPTDIKTLMIDTKIQAEKINELISPDTLISEDNLKAVKPLFEKKIK